MSVLEESAGMPVYLFPGLKRPKVTPQNFFIPQNPFLHEECKHGHSESLFSCLMMFSFDFKEPISGIMLDFICLE